MRPARRRLVLGGWLRLCFMAAALGGLFMADD
jgi:hypothetical protein